MDISPSALTAALGAPVLSSHATLIGRFSCELWRLKLQPSDGTRTVVLKRPKKELGRNSLANERLFYERIGARVQHAPRYLGFVENEGALLLEQIPDLEPSTGERGKHRTTRTSA